MKVEISYKVWKTEVITVPKEWEFWFTKEENEWTDKEWDFCDSTPFLNLPYDDIEIEREIKE